jgi:hypothetical protein
LVTEALRVVPAARFVVLVVTLATLVNVPAAEGVTVMKSTTAEFEPKLPALVVTAPFEKTGWLKCPPGDIERLALTNSTDGGRVSTN